MCDVEQFCTKSYGIEFEKCGTEHSSLEQCDTVIFVRISLTLKYNL